MFLPSHNFSANADARCEYCILIMWLAEFLDQVLNVTANWSWFCWGLASCFLRLA